MSMIQRRSAWMERGWAQGGVDQELRPDTGRESVTSPWGLEGLDGCAAWNGRGGVPWLPT